MKKILITGANGFIGSFLVEEALRRNYDVYAGVREGSNREYLSDSRINFFEMDYSSSEALRDKFSDAPKFDFIIHNAGLTKAVKKSDYLTVNFEYTKNIIDSLVSQNKVPEKFIYMSSLAAFGPADESELSMVKLTDTPRPVTSYGRSKLESEKYLMGMEDFPYLIIRPTAVYGPREKELYTFFKLINRNMEPYIGLKKQYLTFIYIKDLAKAVFHATESDAVNKAYFVSDGGSYDSKTLGKIIKTQLHKKTLTFNIPVGLARFVAFMAEKTNNLTGKLSVLNLEKMNELESVNWKCDIQPLTNETGFLADYDLNDGITETIAWYKKANWL
jgi:nucleoside-diphosphate-sugar epimerase